MADHPPPPPPPPHGARSSKLPDGNYDIFIIPPHSAGSGFLYLPSLKPNLNSYIAGVFSGILVMLLERMLEPLYRQISSLSVNSGLGFFVLFAAVGAAFMFGRTQGEPWTGQPNQPDPSSGAGGHAKPTPQPGPQPSASYPGSFGQEQPHPQPQQAPPKPEPAKPEPPRPKPTEASGPTPWEKAREEVRKREAERKRTDELKKKQEEIQKKKEEDEKAKRAAAEKEKWEQARAREKDAREREARERLAKAKKPVPPPNPGKYEKPTAQSYAESTTSSWQTYDEPRRRNPLGSSASSVSELSESSYATMSTARTTPPPSQRGPYTTKDPDKIIINAVYLFNNMLPQPASQLISNEGSVTDGLILRITTEGLFIDDDVRHVPQREWDVKAWGIKLVETGKLNNTTIFRATLRDADQKRYLFVLPSDQAWKVDMGLERLRKGPLVRAMGMNGIKDSEMKNLLSTLGWLP